MAERANRATLAHRLGVREWRYILIAMVGLLLAACGSSANMGNLFSDDQSVPNIPTGGSKDALLLPLSATAETQKVANALKQAAELALIDARNPGITLITKDTGGTQAGARAAAEAALSEGAELILGPLLSAEVQAVSPIARAKGVNVIAFSSVSTVAGSGTYLLAFLPEEEVGSIVRYASSKGIRNIAALYPQTQYGQKVEQALARSASANGARVAAQQRYSRQATGITTAVQSLAASMSVDKADALFLPEGGEVLRALSTDLEQNGITPQSTKILGTGLWYDHATASIPIAKGGWYAGVSPELIGKFEGRYANNYGNKPPPIASLAYDAVSLAVSLKKANGGFTEQAITNTVGFQGQNGLFRFRQNGLVERGLAILEITDNGPKVIAPAPTRFDSGT
jgi:branched-chain amino acid transport system substrate-binding protein